MRTTDSSTLVDALTGSSFEIINPYDELSNYYKVSKFMNIRKSILELSPTINFPSNDKPLSVLALIGPARRGKSTLLNCIISSLLKGNYSLFETSDTDEHCTYGIDYTIIETEEKNILFFDVQGMGLHDSSNDCKILLYIYLIADIIIFNERNMIDNRTLDNLLPLTTFMTFINESSLIEQSKRPKIMFRISDQDLKADPQQNLIKVLEDRKDQYQNVRESVKKLFSVLLAMKTEPLERSEKALLQNKDYFKFLENNENNFKNVCESIIEELYKTSKFSNFSKYYEYIQKIALELNENKKIDWDKLDLTKHISKQEITEWIKSNVDETKYNMIEVDGTHADYLNKIEPHQKYIENILQNFDNYFMNTTPKIRDGIRNELQTKLTKPYDDAIRKTETISIKKIKERYNTITVELISKYDHIKENEIEHIGNKYVDRLEQTISTDKIINIYYNKIVDSQFQNWKKNMYVNIKKSIENAKKDYDNKHNEKILKLESILIFRIDNIWMNIEKKVNNLYISYDNIMEEMITKFKNEFNGHNIVINTFSFNTCGIIEYKKNDKSNNHLTEEKKNLLAKYEIEIKKYYTKFVETRKENLGVYLKESRYTSNNLEEIRRIYESIKTANNDGPEGVINYVYFLDILPTANYISKMNSNILEKYEIVVDKIKLYEIQTKEDFEKKYPLKIINLYYSLNKDYVVGNETITNIIKNKIIDKLFYSLV
jgi:hypothetical protein